MYCKHCLYNLRGLAEARCPECGTQFDPNIATTFNRYPYGRARTLIELLLCRLERSLFRAAGMDRDDALSRSYCRHCQYDVSQAGDCCPRCGAAIDLRDPVTCSRFPYPAYRVRGALLLRALDRGWFWGMATLLYLALAIFESRSWQRGMFLMLAALGVWLMVRSILWGPRKNLILDAVQNEGRD
jgi:hypothetical protein